MGHVELVEQLSTSEASQGGNLPEVDTSELEHLPRSMKGADELILKAAAAITRLKVREGCEGVPVQLRDDPSANKSRVGLGKYDLHEVFPQSAELLQAIGE